MGQVKPGSRVGHCLGGGGGWPALTPFAAPAAAAAAVVYPWQGASALNPSNVHGSSHHIIT